MTCKEMETRLAGLIDGALDEGERERVEAHLKSCESCRRALAELEASDALVKRLDEVEPPPWLKTRVMARVREEAQGRQSVLRKLFFPLHIKVPIQALATVLIAVVAWNVYRAGETDFRRAAPPPVVVEEARKAEAPREKAKAVEGVRKEEGTVSREKKAFAPPPEAVVEDRGGRTAEPAREMMKADAERPLEPSGAQRSAAAPLKDEEALKGAGAAGQQETDSSAYAPYTERKQKTAKAQPGAATRDAAKREAAPAAAPMLSATLSARPDLYFFLRVRDPAAAACESEALLTKIGARSIDRKESGGQVTLTARIRPEHLDALRQKLLSLGMVREQGSNAPRPEGPLAIRLEFRTE